MRKLLVLVELVGGRIDDSARELASAARSIGGAGGEPCRVAAAVLGERIEGLAEDLARDFDDVHLYNDPRLALPDGEIYASVLRPLLEREKPWLTLIPHTNNGMDLAPSLSVRVGLPLIADCVSFELRDDRRLRP